LLRWFLLRDLRVARVEVAGMPTPLRALCERAVALLGSDIVVVDITTDLEVPSYVALCEGRVGVAGSGASPSAHHAVERAVHEVVQCAAGDAGDVNRALRRLVPWPSLRDCAELSVPLLLAGQVHPVGVPVDPPDIDDPAGRLAWLESRLTRHGIATFSRELAPEGSLISVIASYAPALDRFSLVRLGMPVVPTGRAWALWDEARRG
jgi:ribosomal protein S12 methylthiotransferase accessory factor